MLLDGFPLGHRARVGDLVAVQAILADVGDAVGQGGIHERSVQGTVLHAGQAAVLPEGHLQMAVRDEGVGTQEGYAVTDMEGIQAADIRKCVGAHLGNTLAQGDRLQGGGGEGAGADDQPVSRQGQLGEAKAPREGFVTDAAEGVLGPVHFGDLPTVGKGAAADLGQGGGKGQRGGAGVAEGVVPDSPDALLQHNALHVEAAIRDRLGVQGLSVPGQSHAVLGYQLLHPLFSLKGGVVGGGLGHPASQLGDLHVGDHGLIQQVEVGHSRPRVGGQQVILESLGGAVLQAPVKIVGLKAPYRGGILTVMGTDAVQKHLKVLGEEDAGDVDVAEAVGVLHGGHPLALGGHGGDGQGEGLPILGIDLDVADLAGAVTVGGEDQLVGVSDLLGGCFGLLVGAIGGVGGGRRLFVGGLNGGAVAYVAGCGGQQQAQGGQGQDHNDPQAFVLFHDWFLLGIGGWVGRDVQIWVYRSAINPNLK